MEAYAGNACGSAALSACISADRSAKVVVDLKSSSSPEDIMSEMPGGKQLDGGDLMKVTTSPYDVAEHLRTPEEMAAYLEACIEEADGDAAFIAKALGDIARAQGMTQVARQSGLSRESLHKALSGERSPSFDTILKVVSALGLKLSTSVRSEAEVT
jgi:probable addiction module antidote protein